MTEVERKAIRVMCKCSTYDHRMLYEDWHKEHVEALSRAGLLVTPLHERALEACKEWQRISTSPNVPWALKEYEEVASVGREALALERKPEKYRVHQREGLRPWGVIEPGPFTYLATFERESDARAYAAQKNAEAARQEGR